ncbi:hypothetical protein B0A48_17527 [Cryoendolithus antarcticus]|uniref:Elongation factor 2 n=1 Tax=Cryoendolithus antarcticus TaxID=1507870 RepID=A0A1V8SCD1_9PEZI|nr:hypothetical protein B0A48_17527 [Cryoendolithus antarcticus]
MAHLTAQPLGPTGGFNWIFQVDLLVSAVLALFFLFYFNRLFATVLSYGIRAWTWHKYRAYIDISALQISLLGGRLFFKSIRYHAHNETVLVHDGHITWRYWLRAVQEAEIFQNSSEDPLKQRSRSASGSRAKSESSAEGGSKPRSRSVGNAEAGGKRKKELPCRISVKVSGVEAFLYNRSPAYDGIMEAVAKHTESEGKARGSHEKTEEQWTPSDSMDGAVKSDPTPDLTPITTARTGEHSSERSSPQIPSFLRVFPILIECRKAAAAVGNSTTTSVVVAKLDSASGTVDAGAAGTLDLFKLLFNFQFKNVNVSMKPNRDFKETQLDAAQRILREREGERDAEHSLAGNVLRKLQGFIDNFKSAFVWRRSSGGSVRKMSTRHGGENPVKTNGHQAVPGEAQWHGLLRYLDDSEMNGAEVWQSVEYAKASTLVDCPQVDMRFYWDIPGAVPTDQGTANEQSASNQSDDINGSAPPAYGLDFAVHGGSIVYGPWADRQRINLQHAFFPASYVDATPYPRLKPGETRICTVFKIFVSVEQDVTLRIPTRESSKDFKWRGKTGGSGTEAFTEAEVVDGKHRPRKHRHRRRQKGKKGPAIDARPYAWLDVTVKADSTVNYTMDMFSRHDGYRSDLALDVKGTEITSSVNHGLLWRAGALTMDADLSYAREWRALRDWPFKIVCDKLELFILRDHMFLIQDLVNDWSSGPPADFYTFVPFKYGMDLHFREWCMYLNTNDANIVNEPADFDKNDFLTLEGKSLHAVLEIPLELYRPKQSNITFDVLSQDMRMRLLNSSRNTINTFLTDKQVAELAKLTLKGSFCANAEFSPGLVDVLRMDLVGYGLSMKAHGYLVRLLINVKENYFGDYVHFKTLEEFQDADDNANEANKATASLPKPQLGNEMDVILCIAAEDAKVLFPTSLYTAADFISVELQHGAIDLRVASYYMDLAINFSPISVLQASTAGDAQSPTSDRSNTQLFIKHVDLDGHRAFGLPPTEPAYMATWYVDVGAILGECCESFVHDAALAAKAFTFAFSDRENALPLEAPIMVFDATFLQLKTDIIRVGLHVGANAIIASTDPVIVKFNDSADEVFSQRVTVEVPNLTLACVDASTLARHRAHSNYKEPARTYAFFQTSVLLHVVGRKLHFSAETAKQKSYMREQDCRTHRVPFLSHSGSAAAGGSCGMPLGANTDPAYMPYPFYPAPLRNPDQRSSRPHSVRSGQSLVVAKGLHSKASSSSLAASIRQNSSSRFSGERTSRSNDARFEDQARGKIGIAPATLASASTFAQPYFPLHSLIPDERDVPTFASESPDDVPDIVLPDIIENSDGDENFSHTSILIKVVPGIRVYIEPGVAQVAADLVRIVQPRRPDDVLDDFQISAMGTIAGLQQARLPKGAIVEVKLDLPSGTLRVRHPNDEEQRHDNTDLSLQSLAFMFRQKTLPASGVGTPVHAVHATLASLKAAVHAQSGFMPDDCALAVSVDDLTMWVAMSASRTLHCSVRDVALLMSASKAVYLASLAQRIAPLVLDMQATLERVGAAAQARLKLLLYTITLHDEHIGDPIFMSRMVYILRAYKDHFRNQESWKILARFRHALQCMPREIIRSLETQLRPDDIVVAPQAPQYILDNWAQRRNWDVPNISQTTVFKTLFGPDEKAPEMSAMAPTAITLDSESLRLAVGEGAEASWVLVEELNLAMEVTPASKPTGLMLVEENLRTKTVVQFHSNATDFHFHWRLLDLVEVAIPKALEIQRDTRPPQPQRGMSQSLLSEEIERQDLHIIVATESGSITLQTLNIKHQSRAEELRMSLIGTSQANEQYGQCINAVINASSALTECHSKSACIWKTELSSPRIYVDHLQPAKGAPNIGRVTVAAGYDAFYIDVKEQVAGILHVVDHIIGDEVPRVQAIVEMAKAGQQMAPSQQHDHVPSVAAPTFKFNAAILAGKLVLHISLLKALQYRLEGTSSSIRCVPKSGKDTFSVDFDVGGQVHSFISHGKSNDDRQALLEVPPINGNVGLELGSKDTRLTSATSINTIEIDAAAVQALIGVLSKPEVKAVLEAVESGIDDIKLHAKDVYKTGSDLKIVEKPTANSKTFMYDIRFALLGIRASATTPHLGADSTAHLQLGFGSLHIHASNVNIVAAGEKSLIPEVRAAMHDIGASLVVHTDAHRKPAGNMALAIVMDMTLQKTAVGKYERNVFVRTPSIEVNAYPETAATIVEVINHIQTRIKDMDLSHEVEYLRGLHAKRRRKTLANLGSSDKDGVEEPIESPTFSPNELLEATFKFELSGMQIAWLVDSPPTKRAERGVADLVLSLAKVELAARGLNEAKLSILDLQLQLVPKRADKRLRTLNSALLPEIGFGVAYSTESKKRSLTIKATGKPLDLRLDTKFMVPVTGVQKSIEHAIGQFKAGTSLWESVPTASGLPRTNPFSGRSFALLQVEADFAGAEVYLQGATPAAASSIPDANQPPKHEVQHGRYGQFAPETGLMHTTLRAPGAALKLEYKGLESRPAINGELRIDASTNLLLPNVVQLIREIAASVKEVVKDQEGGTPATPKPKPDYKPQQRFFEDENIVQADPTAFFGKTKVNLGLRICRQEFGLTCQPIAKVDAKAELEDFYVTMNTIEADEHGHFFAMSALLTKLKVSVKHAYSREPTFAFDMDSVTLSLMNSKHFSGVSGISAILKIAPTKTSINGKQLQDLLLFREIWLPPEIRSSRPVAQTPRNLQADDYLVQRYQAVSAAAAFPWNATVSISELGVDLDLGQSIGKSSFTIANLWASSQKTSNYEQMLCIGLDDMAVKSTGRMSGFIDLNKLGVRTSIQWAEDASAVRQTPLIQASIGFDRLRTKAAFDYQAFAFGDIEGFDFLMYNVQNRQRDGRDRLAAVLDCDKTYTFCTSTSPAQAFSLYQAFDRLISEKQAAFTQSLKDIEKHIRRESVIVPTRFGPQVTMSPTKTSPTGTRTPLSLHTDVVITLGTISIGAFPSTFFDSQILKLEANNIQARFAVGLEKGKLHSGLGMTLGQLQVALAAAKRVTVPKTLGDINVDEIIASAVGAKGGTILRVPKVVASMQTWQAPQANEIEYIFKSLFEGKVDVGWNLNRINFIQGMYITHTRALAARLGKALPPSAVKITADLQEDTTTPSAATEQHKITAEVNLPQSKYSYIPLEPPVIETPQLRDMGEATPPLEWIGLNRERLPGVTHQVLIVGLLEVAKEVEDAYERILGSS